MTPDGWHLLSEHRASWSRRFARYRLQFVLAGVFLAIVGILLALEIVDEGGALFWAGAIVVFYLLPWTLVALVANLRGIKRVRVFEEGLAWTVGRRAEVRSWDDVRELIRSEIVLQLGKPEARLTLVFKKKEQLILDQSLSDFFPLATLVEGMVTERLLPQYRQALDEGEGKGAGGAYFGPIVLKRQGIRIHDREFTWNEVEECTIHGGGLVVTPRAYDDFTGEFADFRSIPNTLVLLRLLEELGQTTVPAQKSVFLSGRKPAPDV